MWKVSRDSLYKMVTVLRVVRRSTWFGFYISFSKFQNLGVAGLLERDYIGETNTLLEDMTERERIEETGSLLLDSDN